MMIAEPKDLRPEQLEELEEGLGFADRAVTEYHQVLWIPLTLAVDEDGESISLPKLALPVPERAKSERGSMQALPGAPWALLTGQQSIYQDTRQLSEDLADLSADIREEIQSYFAFRIDGGLSDRPVGVLNIDSSKPCVLGSNPEFCGTFFALIAPYLQLMAHPLEVLTRSVLKGTDLFRTRTEAKKNVVGALVEAVRPPLRNIFLPSGRILWRLQDGYSPPSFSMPSIGMSSSVPSARISFGSGSAARPFVWR